MNVERRVEDLDVSGVSRHARGNRQGILKGSRSRARRGVGRHVRPGVTVTVAVAESNVSFVKVDVPDIAVQAERDTGGGEHGNRRRCRRLPCVLADHRAD